MEKWEYVTVFIRAHIGTQGVKEFLQQRWPDWKKIPKFAPQAMIPELNTLGEQGWELVHMEPIPVIGTNADVGFPSGDSSSPLSNYLWSNCYFCAFKRRKPE